MKGFQKREWDSLTDIELIAELQHYGCATMLIDFTRNPLVALYFAVSAVTDDGAAVYLVDIKKANFMPIGFQHIQDRSTKSLDLILSGQGSTYYWEPSTLNKRIPAQHSIFLCDSRELSSNMFDVIVIDKKYVGKILEELKRTYNIDDVTLFNDIPGFSIANSQDKSLDLSVCTGGIGIFENNSNLQKENLENDLKKIKQQINLSYENYYNLLEKGDINYLLGHYEEAISDFDKAIEIEPRQQRAYSNRGTAKFALNRYEEAISDYDKAIGLLPTAKTYFSRGTAHFKLGKYQLAIDDYNKAIEMDPQTAINYHNRAIVYLKIGKTESAINDFTKAIELEPKKSGAYIGLGNLMLNKGNYNEASLQYSKAIELDQTDAVAFNNRGLAYAQMSKNIEALNDFDKSISIDPKYIEAYVSRSYIYLLTNQYEKASNDCDTALKLNNNHSLAYLNRAIAKALMGATDQARADYQKTYQLAKESNDSNALNEINETFDQNGILKPDWNKSNN